MDGIKHRATQNPPASVTTEAKATGAPQEVAATQSSALVPDAKPKSLVGELFNSRLVGNVYSFLTDHPMWAEQNKKLMDHFGPNAPADPKIIDLGAGTGVGTLAIAEALDGRGEVIGIDFSAAMVGHAERNRTSAPARNVSFQQGDATNLAGFEDNSVDFVIAHSFLYLVPDQAAVLAEVRRVLKPGGRVVFMEPREEGSFVGAAAVAATHLGAAAHEPLSAARLGCAMVAWRVMSGIEGRPKEGQLTELFTDAGFESVRFEPTLGGIGHHVVAE